MDKRKLKFTLIGLGVLASMGLLLLAAINQPGNLAYYLSVDEYLKSRPATDDNFRVNGKVKEGSIVREPSGMDVTFTMTDGTAEMPVAYHGTIPDTFVDGADVVVQGAIGSSGVFVADNMLAKCPSKYEAADGADPKGRTAYGQQPN